jgi:hypothetical protein
METFTMKINSNHHAEMPETFLDRWNLQEGDIVEVAMVAVTRCKLESTGLSSSVTQELLDQRQADIEAGVYSDAQVCPPLSARQDARGRAAGVE